MLDLPPHCEPHASSLQWVQTLLRHMAHSHSRIAWSINTHASTNPLHPLPTYADTATPELQPTHSKPIRIKSNKRSICMKILSPLIMIVGMCGSLFLLAGGLDNHVTRYIILGICMTLFYTYGLYKTLPARL